MTTTVETRTSQMCILNNGKKKSLMLSSFFGTFRSRKFNFRIASAPFVNQTTWNNREMIAERQRYNVQPKTVNKCNKMKYACAEIVFAH